MKLLPALARIEILLVGFVLTLGLFAPLYAYADVDNAEILKKMQALESKVASLEKRLAKYEAQGNENASAKMHTNPYNDQTPAAGKGSMVASSDTPETPKNHALFGLVR